MVRDLLASRELAWRLFARNMAQQYRQSALGYVWAVAPPLVTSSLFILLNSAGLLRAGDTGVPYPVYVILGTVSFALFLDALNLRLNAIAAARGTLPKINFPHEALLLAGLGQVLLNFAVKTTLIVAVLAIFRIPVSWTAVLALIPLAGLLLTGLALGILLVPSGTLFQDVGHALAVVASGLVFVTPAAYMPPRAGLLAVITAWNPLTPLVMSARDLIVHGSSSQMPASLLLVGAGAVALLVSWVSFRLAMPILIERMGN
jgi:lipopolysaccharide transport system permease protein